MFAAKIALTVALASAFLTAGIGAQISSTYLSPAPDHDYDDTFDYDSSYGSGSDDDQDAQEPTVVAVVTDGDPAKASFAYTVAVGKWGSSFCGGWLYDNYTVVTAASCVDHLRNTFGLSVTVNRYNLTDRTKGQEISVRNFKYHEQYDSKTHNFDVAILKLKDPAQIDVPLPIPMGDVTRDRLQQGAELIVLGWGSVSSTGVQLPPDLRQGTVAYVGSRQCDEKFYGEENRVTDQMVCGSSTNGQDACAGDAGGPLVLQNLEVNKKDEIVGIVSWGDGCAVVGKPGVYTAMTPEIKDWIEYVSASL